jgi:isoleucyl-tRNA synthetase
MEKDLLETWKAERLFQRTLEANRDGKPFVFYEGPPTANGRPGIHHVFSRTIKDLVCRYHAMQGESVTRIAGWDTHGLPVEIEVEKQLGLTGGKKAIEQYGVEKFNAKCRENVFTYKQDWEQLSDRIAYWLDYEHPYITYSNDYVESVWWLLSRLYEKRMLYRGHRVLPYCPRCGTALSSHELALGYEKNPGPLDLCRVPAGRRERARAHRLDHHSLDAAFQRRGRGSSRSRIRHLFQQQASLAGSSSPRSRYATG